MAVSSMEVIVLCVDVSLRMVLHKEMSGGNSGGKEGADVSELVNVCNNNNN